MSKRTILIQLDSDRHASVFDSVVAIDAGVDQLLTHADVTEDNVEGLVHGAMFTRGGDDLRCTAIFVGGSNVEVAESITRKVQSCFFGPLRVSTMMDANGANTTAAAAVIAAGRHLDLSASQFTVLGSTGPVGRRIVRLLAGQGARVQVVSRSEQRAAKVCDDVRKDVEAARLSSFGAETAEQVKAVLAESHGLIAAGAAGIQLVAEDAWSTAATLKLAIDLNAVPPAGIEGIEIADKAADRHDRICYGPIGVGGTKMKIHKAAIQRLFESNSLSLDAESIFEIGRDLESS